MIFIFMPGIQNTSAHNIAPLNIDSPDQSLTAIVEQMEVNAGGKKRYIFRDLRIEVFRYENGQDNCVSGFQF
jgi:hypothetical protein